MFIIPGNVTHVVYWLRSAFSTRVFDCMRSKCTAARGGASAGARTEFCVHPRLRHGWRGQDILHFMFSDSITKYHVSNATLFVYVKGAERRPLPDVLIEVFKVYKAPDHPDSPGLYRMVSKKVTQPLGRGDWVKLDLTITVSEWFKNPRENFGFVVNATANGKKVVVTDTTVEDGSKAPFVEVSTMEARRRTRRNVGLNCDDKMNEPLCCRYPLIVDFEEFGWDFIIAPKRYDAHYCSGECPYITLQKHAHTHLMKIASPNSAQPCCAPRKMSAISMLYFDQQLNVVYGSLPGMVVDRTWSRKIDRTVIRGQPNNVRSCGAKKLFFQKNPAANLKNSCRVWRSPIKRVFSGSRHVRKARPAPLRAYRRGHKLLAGLVPRLVLIDKKNTRRRTGRREGMPKSPKVRKESSKREREEGRTSEEGTNPFRKSTRTGRFPSRSEEGNKSKEMDKEMKTMIRDRREDTARIREENKVLRKELAAVREEMRGREEKWHAEEADWIERMKVIEEKMEQTEKKERKNNVKKERRRTGEKRYKENVNKKVGGQRKRKQKHKGESRDRKSTNGKIKEQEKKKGKATDKEMKTTRRRVEDAMKENREDRILSGGDFNWRIGERGARNWEEERGGWENKIQRQGGKFRGEETDGMDRRKWMRVRALRAALLEPSTFPPHPWLQLNQAVGTSKQAACVCGPTFPVCPIHYTINSSTRSLIGLGPIDKTFKSPLSIALLQSCVTPAQTLVTLIPIRVGRGATAATFVSVSITVKRRRGSCKADRGWDRCSSLFYHRARLSVISPSRDRDGRGIQVARFRRFRPKYDKKLRKRRCYRFGDGGKMVMGRSGLFGHFGGV
ncbi:hypothetical protein GEV33_015148 [Tenebrio molitor]|uniref:TGF-beta family profile domain-containing protein n=1 Tax=Tenebrio molitor TaxID=7067 RepID=A0A8J6H3V3_TENMO|nr:hypothetical protein GEV33_015149 [Tenebrio molitor]KAH0807643.1 hypothetical protein GEV33_015148 [Tenebrio molitor]